MNNTRNGNGETVRFNRATIALILTLIGGAVTFGAWSHKLTTSSEVQARIEQKQGIDEMRLRAVEDAILTMKDNSQAISALRKENSDAITALRQEVWELSRQMDRIDQATQARARGGRSNSNKD